MLLKLGSSMVCGLGGVVIVVVCVCMVVRKFVILLVFLFFMCSVISRVLSFNLGIWLLSMVLNMFLVCLCVRFWVLWVLWFIFLISEV